MTHSPLWRYDPPGPKKVPDEPEPSNPPQEEPNKEPEAVPDIAEAYRHLIKAVAELERVIDRHQDQLSEQEHKRLDKSVTVVKVGLKLTKKVLRGYRRHGSLKIAV